MADKSLINATPSWKSLGGWLAAVIIVVGVAFVMNQFTVGRSLMNGVNPWAGGG
jgi:hypothetical protein